MPKPNAGATLAGAAALLIAAVTLFPLPSQVTQAAATPFWCVVCGSFGVVDVTLNVLLFVPLGAGLAHARIAPRRAALTGAAFSAIIELLQLSVVTGRDASLSDLLTNTIGTGLGVWLAGAWHGLVRPSPRRAAALAALAAAAWLGQVALTAFAVQPSLPRSTYWGQHAPDLPQFERFEGAVQRAWVGGLALPPYRLKNSAEVRDSLLAGAPFGALATVAQPTPGLAPIVSIFDGEQREIVLLGQRGRDLVFRLRSRAADLRLRPPALVAAGAAPETGTALRITGRLHGAALDLDVAAGPDPAPRTAYRLALSAQWGWSLLLPFSYFLSPRAHWLTAIWIAAWLAAIGFWGRQVRRPRFVGIAGGVTIAAGLWLLPRCFGLQGPMWWEWLAAAAGAALGAWLAGAGKRSRRDRQVVTTPPSAFSASSP